MPNSTQTSTPLIFSEQLTAQKTARSKIGFGRQTCIFIFFLLMAICDVAIAGPDQDTLTTTSLKNRPLEELMNIDITVLSKHPQRWSQTPGDVFVITSEDIRRSGARSIPEALRLAPNMNVARETASDWAISSRGFNTNTSNKMLALIDGRIIYNGLVSGVFWPVQDVLMEDIERIEIISGPGGTLWGTNAVNGVINIIRKTPQGTATSPVYVEGGAGVDEKVSGAVRYSNSIGASTFYRAYAKYFERDESDFQNGMPAGDGWIGTQVGGGLEFDVSENDKILVQGDLYRVKVHEPAGENFGEGGNIMAKWNHDFSGTSTLMVLSYFDYTKIHIPNFLGEDRRIYDTQVEYHVGFGAHGIGAGLGLRGGNTAVINSNALAFLPTTTSGIQYNAFLQDVISLGGGVKLTLGSKFIKSTSRGLELQPRASIGWSISPHEYIWGSVTRALRTPSRFDRDLYLPGVPPYVLQGGPEFVSERLLAYETGYTRQMSANLLLSIALFYNMYDDLRTIEPTGPALTTQNGLETTTYGGTASITTQVSDWWRLRLGYSHLQKDINLKPWSMDVNKGLGEGNDHKHRLILISSMDVATNWEADLMFRFVDRLPLPTEPVPPYGTMDARLGWNPTSDWSVSFLVRNIFTPRHAEWGPPATQRAYGREFFGKISFSI